ncbi:MAG: hypothetical protein HOP19_28145, partial [Acidobacteria bacterium]|nr:hypothetical protein [Acidobacteriota bacterium]
SDVETVAGGLTVFAAVPAGLTLTNLTNTNGVISANVAATCLAATGAQNLTLTVRDDAGATASTPIVINVTANTPPALGYAATHSLNAGAALTINPAVASDNGTIANFAVQSAGTYTGALTSAQTACCWASLMHMGKPSRAFLSPLIARFRRAGVISSPARPIR